MTDSSTFSVGAYPSTVTCREQDRSGATGGARPLDDVREGDTNGSNGSVEHAKLHGSAIDGGPGGSSAEGPPNRAEDKSIAAAAAAALGLGLRLGSGESSLANGDRDIVNSDNAVETRRPDSNGNGKDGALSGSTQAEVEGLTVNPASTSMEESTEEVDVEAIRAPGAKEERSQGATAEAQEPIAATTAPSPVDGGQETSSSTAELQRQQQQPDEHSYSIGGEDWLDGDQEDAADGLDRDGDGRAVGGGGSNVVLVSRDGGGAGVEEEKGVILPGESVAGGGPSPGGARVGSGGSSVDGGEVGGGRAPEAGIGVGGGGEAYAGPGDLAWIPSTPPGKALHEAQVGRSFEDSRLQRSTTDLERMPATRLLRPTSKYMHEDLAEAKKRQNQ